MRPGPAPRNAPREKTTQVGFKLPVSVAEAIDAEALERGRRATKSDVVRDALISFPPIQRQLSKRPRAVA